MTMPPPTSVVVGAIVVMRTVVEITGEGLLFKEGMEMVVVTTTTTLGVAVFVASERVVTSVVVLSATPVKRRCQAKYSKPDHEKVGRLNTHSLCPCTNNWGCSNPHSNYPDSLYSPLPHYNLVLIHHMSGLADSNPRLRVQHL